MIRRLFLKLFRRRSLQRDLEAELAFHRDMAAAQGNAISLGNTAIVKEQALDLWRFNRIENLWRDVIYAARGLRRSPTLVLSALLSLGLAIGVNTAIFSLAVEFLLSEPSVRDGSSIVSVRLSGNSHQPKDVVEFVRNAGLFEDVVGENEETFINWNDGSDSRHVFAVQTTMNYFTALGVPVAHGRGIVPRDPKEVVVLNNRFWRKYYGGDPAIVGRAMNLDGRAYTIVGVLPANYRSLIGFGFSPDVYVPRYLDDTVLAMYARLKQGMSIGQARAGVDTLARRLDKAIPAPSPYEDEIQVQPVAGIARLQTEREMQSIGLFFLMLLVVVGLVLLIACVNVASLLLARGSVRRQEFAIRLSLGASKGRLLQQLLVDSLLLSILGALCGLALRQVFVTALARIQLPLPLPIQPHFELDWRITVYAALLTGFATVACGLLPAWRSVKQSISPDLRHESRLRLQRWLVAGQIAVSLVVLTTGFLFLRNLLRSKGISPGFDVRHTLRADVNLPPGAYKDVARKRLYVSESLTALEALPGIEAVAAARLVPFTDVTRFGIPIQFTDTGERVHTSFYWNAVSPDYFRVMTIPVVRGRTFIAEDRTAAADPVIVNRAFVNRYMSSRDPLGRIFSWGINVNKKTSVVVGVVEGTKNITLGEGDQPQLYEDLARIDNDRTRLQFVLRSATPPSAQIQAVHDALRRVDANAGLEVQTLFSSIGLAFLPSQVGAVLLGGVGLLGLVLATIGLYGVMVYSVTRRTREIGVRIAVGANRSHIARMILGDAAKLIGVGSLIGLTAALFVTKPLAFFLVPGLRPTDPVTYATVVMILAATGLVAAWGPVRRAAAVDPMSSLRYE